VNCGLKICNLYVAAADMSDCYLKIMSVIYF